LFCFFWRADLGDNPYLIGVFKRKKPQ
jgi:hypothetical protein